MSRYARYGESTLILALSCSAQVGSRNSELQLDDDTTAGPGATETADASAGPTTPPMTPHMPTAVPADAATSEATPSPDVGQTPTTPVTPAPTGGADSGSPAPQDSCENLPGPLMVSLSSGNKERFCIDSTEVTRAHYQEFLDSSPMPEATGSCRDNSTLVPPDDYPFEDRRDHPVGHVDWCDAQAYCQWANKELCGHVEGGTLDWGDPSRLEASWFSACSFNGNRPYPYGDQYQLAVCVDTMYDGKPGTQPSDWPVAVKTARKCKGPEAPYDGLFDLAGNVEEWLNSCEDDFDLNDRCRAAGSHARAAAATTSRCRDRVNRTRNYTSAVVGFRCCKTPSR